MRKKSLFLLLPLLVSDFSSGALLTERRQQMAVEVFSRNGSINKAAAAAAAVASVLNLRRHRQHNEDNDKRESVVAVV